ncbi:MAG: hypothetical protein HY075_15525 [Deltaproteobacteria bacterium]|nr:hypothetical protein [Deltaproteobacteria bacterium]
MKIGIPALCMIGAVGAFLWAKEGRPGRSPETSKAQLAKIVGKRLVTGSQEQTDELKIQYSIDSRMQQTIEQVYKRGGVPFGSLVAIDPRSGQVLAMVSHGMRGENMALRSSFPAASIFKVVTAAAALEGKKLSHDSLIPVRGSYHTLYKRNVMAGGGIDPANSPRHSRLISFEEALAKSVNSVFGKVGLFGVGSESLRKIATRFQFGKQIPLEMPVDVDQAVVPDDGFGVAESASGYTRQNTLSPVHGALIAAAIANGGVMMEPSVIDRVISKDGKTDYLFQPTPLATVMEKSTAEELGKMMHKTITDGTSRRAFNRVDRSVALNDVFIAGKTGTLNGWDPAGRYDWFVGFAEKEGQKIAVAALCVHGSRYGVKASQVARAAFEVYFGSTIAQDTSDAIQRAAHLRGGRHRRRSRRARAAVSYAPPVAASHSGSGT